MSIQSLKHSDCITTTTEKLSQTFGRFNKNVHIFRNMFDWELPQWNFDKKKVRKEMIPEWNSDKDIVVGWAGLTSHFEDIKRMHGIFKHIHDKYPNTKFVLAGMALKDTQIEIQYDEKGRPNFKEKEIQDENILYRNRVKNLYSDLDSNRLKIFDALPLEEYAKFYALFDISLAYVEHNAFASCKSEIKVIESLHYDCISVFSDFGGYHDFWKEVPQKLKRNNVGISVTSPKVWSNALEYWIEHYDEAKKYFSELRKYSDETYDINKHIEERLSFYMEEIEHFDEEQTNEIAKYTYYNAA